MEGDVILLGFQAEEVITIILFIQLCYFNSDILYIFIFFLLIYVWGHSFQVVWRAFAVHRKNLYVFEACSFHYSITLKERYLVPRRKRLQTEPSTWKYLWTGF